MPQVLVLADSAQGVQAQALEPLRALTGVVVREIPDCSIGSVQSVRATDIVAVALQPHFRRTEQEVLQAVAALCDWCGHVCLLDSTDPTALRWPAAMERTALYVKKQVLRDRSAYTGDSATGFWFADWCAQERGWDIGDWTFSRTRPSEQGLSRLRCAWTLGAARTHRQFARLCRVLQTLRVSTAWERRRIDVQCVVKVMGKGDASFYTRHRVEAVENLKSLGGPHTTLLAAFGGEVPPPMGPFQYRRSLLSSRITVSPFGWGEICHRDYEAFAAGSLLVKPDMRLVESHPDLFRPFETYIPVKWDLSDLASTCEHWLAHHAEAKAIAARGQAMFRSYALGGAVAEQAAALCRELRGPST